MQVGLLPPDPHIENEECVYCFNDFDSDGGVNICLKCFTCCCVNHAIAHFVEREHPHFLSRKRITTISDKTPEKLAIGVEGGFDGERHSFDFELRQFGATGYDALPLDSIDDPSALAVIERLKHAPPASSTDLVTAWELEIVECPHAQSLVQDAEIARLTDVRCSECDLDHGLWLCLQCGHVGCGRRNFDGSGGNGHGLSHFDATRHPVVVKLGTISPDGRADVFCYACDSNVCDSRIVEHLAACGIDIGTSAKTEATTGELEIELNKQWDFEAVTVNGREFHSGQGPFSVGLRNLGNTCYAASILQTLVAIPEFVDEFTSPDCQTAIWTDPRRQFCRLISAMRDADRPSVSPRLWRSVICRDRPAFLGGQQQDAVEFFQYLFNYIKVHNPQTSLSLAEFDEVQVCQCTSCAAVSTIPMRDQPLLILMPPPRPNIDEDFTIALDDLVRVSLAQDLPDRRCDKCNSRGAASRVELKNFPDYLFVSVQLDVPVGGIARKMSVNVDLEPDRFDLSDYVCRVEESVDEKKVAELMDFGFPRAQCVRALQNVATVEAAIDWIVEHPMEQSLAVAEVVRMGFTEDEARDALEQTQGNVGLAVEWLLGPRQKRKAAAKSDGVPVYRLAAFVQHKGTSALCGHYIANVRRDGTWVMYNDRKCSVYPDDAPPQFGRGYLYLFRRAPD
jgi:ubiquitin carboxyl-terminal hydrolase 5/13